MVVIRLSRGGAKKRPFYHMVVTDKRNRRDGRYIERVGYFNPIATGGEIPLHVNQERVDHWLSMGAQPSDRVAKLLKNFAKGNLAAEKAAKSQKAATKKASAKAAEVAKIAAEAAEAAKEEAPAEEAGE